MFQKALFISRTMLFLLGFSLLTFANDEWSRFRGPNGTGLSTATNLPVEFGPEKSVVWKTALPPGHSSPVLARNHIFVTAHTPTTAKDKTTYQLFVIALDRKTGKELWRSEIPRTNKGRLENVNGPASASPVTDGENVYAFFQDFGLIAFSAAGREKWRMPLPAMNIFYGYGASPILADGLVILPVDQDSGSYLLAVDKNTGKVKWKTDRPNVISGYSTPTVWQPKEGAKTGPKQLIIPESFQLSAYSLADGKRVWWVRGLACEMKSVISYDNE
ncbi:MAG: PQQ-binding-like beta-propeller repeat protein, partial [Blastocatellia bacterium]